MRHRPRPRPGRIGAADRSSGIDCRSLNPVPHQVSTRGTSPPSPAEPMTDADPPRAPVPPDPGRRLRGCREPGDGGLRDGLRAASGSGPALPALPAAVACRPAPANCGPHGLSRPSPLHGRGRDHRGRGAHQRSRTGPHGAARRLRLPEPGRRPVRDGGRMPERSSGETGALRHPGQSRLGRRPCRALARTRPDPGRAGPAGGRHRLPGERGRAARCPRPALAGGDRERGDARPTPGAGPARPAEVGDPRTGPPGRPRATAPRSCWRTSRTCSPPASTRGSC